MANPKTVVDENLFKHRVCSQPNPPADASNDEGGDRLKFRAAQYRNRTGVHRASRINASLKSYLQPLAQESNTGDENEIPALETTGSSQPDYIGSILGQIGAVPSQRASDVVETLEKSCSNLTVEDDVVFARSKNQSYCLGAIQDNNHAGPQSEARTITAPQTIPASQDPFSYQSTDVNENQPPATQLEWTAKLAFREPLQIVEAQKDIEQAEAKSTTLKENIQAMIAQGASNMQKRKADQEHLPRNAPSFTLPIRNLQPPMPRKRYFLVKFDGPYVCEKAKKTSFYEGMRKKFSKIQRAYENGDEVYLFFVIPYDKILAGYAKVKSQPSNITVKTRIGTENHCKIPLQWIRTSQLKFYQAQDIRNALNDNKRVCLGGDGKEIDGECGAQLCELYEEARRNPW